MEEKNTHQNPQEGAPKERSSRRGRRGGRRRTPKPEAQNAQRVDRRDRKKDERSGERRGRDARRRGRRNPKPEQQEREAKLTNRTETAEERVSSAEKPAARDFASSRPDFAETGRPEMPESEEAKRPEIPYTKKGHHGNYTEDLDMNELPTEEEVAYRAELTGCGKDRCCCCEENVAPAAESEEPSEDRTVEIVGVGFMKGGKSYYFDPAEEKYEMGDLVIVETARGLELGHITIPNRMISRKDLVAALKGITRRATEQDLAKYRANLAKRDEAMKVCAERIERQGLDMKLIDAEFTIDGSKVIFYFASEGRVDFRNLVKDLATHFRMRIELRQIGVRDEAKMIGGIGICGRPLCCSYWLSDFQPVSIKMAKVQNLSLNPAKISGTCGRLMCCLNFENEAYKELRKNMPSEGERVETPDGIGKVATVDLFHGKAGVRLLVRDEETGEERFAPEVKTYFKQELAPIEKKHGSRHGKNKKDAAPENEEMPESADTLGDLGELEELGEVENPEDLEALKELEALEEQE